MFTFVMRASTASMVAVQRTVGDSTDVAVITAVPLARVVMSPDGDTVATISLLLDQKS